MGFPTTLQEFQAAFPDEQACWATLRQVRWPEGFVCPRCEHETSSWISLSQPLMVRQPRAENQSVFRRRDHAGSHLDASPPPHLGASSLLRRLLPRAAKLCLTA